MRRRLTTNNDSTEKAEEEPESSPSEERIEENDNEVKKSAYSRFCERMSFMKYVFIILIIPPILNYASLKRENAALVPSMGQYVDMGWAQKMFLSCTGEGLPTILLEAPTGGTSDVWYLIQQQLSKISKVCVYDRAGLGFSDVPFINELNEAQKTHNRKFVSQIGSLAQMTSDLHHLVTVAKPLSRPFVLVGSEIGGLVVRHYSLTYPQDVSDIVLLNPLVEDLFLRQRETWDTYWNEHLLPSLQSLQLSAYVGISRIAAHFGWLKPDLFGGSVPKEVELRQISHLCNPTHMSAVFHEHLLLNTSFSQMSEIWQEKQFPKSVSVTVINSKKFDKIPPSLQKTWQLSQLHLKQSLHPSCRHFESEGTAGQLYSQPQVVVGQVQQLVLRWRNTFEHISPSVHTFREQESLFE